MFWANTDVPMIKEQNTVKTLFEVISFNILVRHVVKQMK